MGLGEEIGLVAISLSRVLCGLLPLECPLAAPLLSKTGLVMAGGVSLLVGIGEDDLLVLFAGVEKVIRRS